MKIVSSLDAIGAKFFYGICVAILVFLQVPFLVLFFMMIVKAFTGESSIYAVIGVVVLWILVTTVFLGVVMWAKKNLNQVLQKLQR